MGREQRDILIMPRRGRKEKPLPADCLFIVNPTEAETAYRILAGDVQRQSFAGHSCVGVHSSGSLCIAGPALGAAAASLVLEKLVVLGVTRIFLVSCCGTLDPSLAIGDLLLGRGAVSGEGVSQYYCPGPYIEPDRRILETCRQMLAREEQHWRECVIWSTDAPYREQRAALIGLQEQWGVSGVDMEYSALCSVARFRAVSLGGLFVVSDELWRTRWQHGFGSTVFKKRCQDTIEWVVKQMLLERKQ